MATGQVELVGTTFGSAGNGAHTYDKVFDGDFVTYFDATAANGAAVGVDAGAAVTITAVKFAPRRGDSNSTGNYDFEDRIESAQIQVSSTSDFSSDVTTIDTIPTPIPYYWSYNWNQRTIAGAPSKRYARWLSPTGGHCNLAELRFLANAGPSSAKPVQPVIAPWGGRYPTGSTTVTVTCTTTSATIYYTTDGTTPTTSSQLYGGPVMLNMGVGNAITFKAIASDASLGTTTSDVSTAIFNGWGHKPIEDWYDDRGILIECHNCGVIINPGGTAKAINGYYYRYGTNSNRYSYTQVALGGSNGLDGIWCYKSTDLYNWTFVGNVLPLPPSISTYVLRTHVLYNTVSGKYVLWSNNYPDADGSAAIATASDPEGPWTWVNTRYTPGSTFRDNSLWQDDDGTAYAIWNNGTPWMVIQPLTAANFLTVTGSPTTVMVSSSGESPVMFKDQEGKYLIVQASGDGYDSAGAAFELSAYVAPAVTGPWQLQPNIQVNTAHTVYAGQGTQILKFTGGFGLLLDYWVSTDLYASRQTWQPIDHDPGQLASWDWTRINQIPSNTLKINLMAFYSLSELSSSAAAVDRIGALDAAVITGTVPSTGMRLRARDCYNGGSGFTRASSATFNVGSGSFFFNAWVSFNDLSSTNVLFAKDDGSTGRQYSLYTDHANGDKLTWAVSANNTSMTTVVATSTGAPALLTWYMVTAWRHAATNEIGIAVNGTVINTNTFSSSIPDASTAFTIGDDASHAKTLKGRLRNLGLWKRSKPTTVDLAALYNGGSDLPYEFMAMNGIWTFYDSFRKKLGKKTIDLSSDAFAIALFTSASNANTSTLSTLGQVTNEISATGGYALHGRTILNRAWTVGASAKQFQFAGSGAAFTASGASLNNVKFAVLHDATVGASAGLHPLIAFTQLSALQFSVSTGTVLKLINSAPSIFTLT